MSLRPMLWALYETPCDDPIAKLVLMALAEHATPTGAGAFPSHATLAEAVPCSRATIKRKLADLERAGLIVRGDQELVSHYRIDRRPVVWNLPVAGAQAEPPTIERGLSDPDNGGSGGGSLVSYKPKENLKINRADVARGEAGDGRVLGCASHRDHRQPACQDCQRVQPPTRAMTRPASLDKVRAARAALHESTTTKEAPCQTSTTSP